MWELKSIRVKSKNVPLQKKKITEGLSTIQFATATICRKEVYYVQSAPVSVVPYKLRSVAFGNILCYKKKRKKKKVWFQVINNLTFLFSTLKKKCFANVINVRLKFLCQTDTQRFSRAAIMDNNNNVPKYSFFVCVCVWEVSCVGAKNKVKKLYVRCISYF